MTRRTDPSWKVSHSGIFTLGCPFFWEKQAIVQKQPQGDIVQCIHLLHFHTDTNPNPTLFAHLALAHLTPLPLLLAHVIANASDLACLALSFPPFVPYPCLTASRLKIRRLRRKRIAQTLVDWKPFFCSLSAYHFLNLLALKKHYRLPLCRGNSCFSLKVKGTRMCSLLHWQWCKSSSIAVCLDKRQEEFTHLIIRET